jgi:glutamate-1-semialdehyde 2,1-aminomutase
MTATTSSTTTLHERALKVLPGGNTRSTVFVPPTPPYAAKGEGAYVTDVDGHIVIDCNNNYTALIHGHRFEPIINAVQETLNFGTAFGLPTESEVDLATELTRRLPAAEQWRFVNSGTEAVMQAIRIARAHTHRDLLVRFTGSYHGTSDAVVDTAAPGIPNSINDSVVSIPVGDAVEYNRVIREHGPQIAAVILDLMPNRAGLAPADPEFVNLVRETTEANGALLIFDEVITFRSGFGGLQEQYGIEPDLTTLGKVVGGGFPVGAVGGKTEVMAVTNPAVSGTIAWGGTFSANPVTMRAGLAALKAYERPDIELLNTRGNSLREELRRAGVRCSGFGSLLRIFPENMTTTWWAAYNEGLLLGTNGLLALSTAMDDSDLGQILERTIKISS